MEAYPGKIRLILKNFPYKYRDYSHMAAEALLAAGAQGKYWEMHDLMLERSPRLDQASLEKYAEELGLDGSRFKKDLEREKYWEAVEQDKELSEKMEIYNTPTFFINGRKVIGNRPYEYLKDIVEEELGARESRQKSGEEE